MVKISTRRIAVCATIAALYVVLTMGFGIISYGPIQIRFAEILNLLAFFNPVFIVAMTAGVLVSNIFSPFGVIDMAFGTLASFISLVMVWFSAKWGLGLLVASIWPIVVNAIIIAFVILYGTSTPITLETFLPISASVGIGQTIAMIGMAYPLFRYLTKHQSHIIDKIRDI